MVVPLVAGVATGATVVGCLDDATVTGLGTSLASGDVDGDGIPEIAVGTSLRVANRSDGVRLVSLADVADGSGVALGCTDPTSIDDPEVRDIPCTADLGGAAASCDGFGAALAFGDADGDGLLELLVGAPLAGVGTTSHAGAAYLFQGNAQLDVFASAANEPRVLVDSSPSVNDTLGLAVTFLPSQLDQTDAATIPRNRPRAEPVASAPGANRIFVFLCTGLVGDSVDEDPSRCIVER
jgi:hypothetical protein